MNSNEIKAGVKTKILDGGIIEQTVECDINGTVQQISRQIVNTSEDQLKNALIKLGWSPPESKTQKKVVDLSVLISSGVDCELSNNGNAWHVGKLVKVGSEEGQQYNGFRYCRPRMNHWHYWSGGECPLPKGFHVQVYLRDGSEVNIETSRPDQYWRWVAGQRDSDLIAFKVTGLAEGYCWPWELNND